MPSPTPPAALALDQLGIPYRLFIHPGPIHSLEQAATERGQQPQQVIRSLLFRISGEEFIMVLVCGPGQVSWKELRRVLGLSRMTMATDEEVLQVTGALPGTVSPLGLLQPVRLLVDECLLTQPEVSLGSGLRGTAIIITPQDLLRAVPSHEIVHIEKSR